MADETELINRISDLINISSVSIWEALGISVIASILSVGIIGVIGFIYKKGINEIIQKAIKRTQLNIQGEWVAKGKVKIDEENSYTYRDQTTIKQIGRNILGESLYTTNSNGKEETKKYKIAGFIKNDVVVGTYENIETDSIGVGSFILIVKNDGKKLEGNYQIYNVYGRNIQPWPYEFFKKIK